ncbi:MAG: hypothetical protein V4819_12620 [Verrucomicrobiota bacterium]
MKVILNICSAASLACVLCIATGNFDTLVPEAVARHTMPSVNRNLSTAPIALGTHARSKVLRYFDTYRGEPMGLPPASAASVKLGEIPAAWMNSSIRTGVVVQESDRSALVEAPAQLVRVLPAQSGAVRYYLAGSNLVTVNENYKVLDSVRIPTVRLPGNEPAADAEPLQLVRHVDRRSR